MPPAEVAFFEVSVSQNEFVTVAVIFCPTSPPVYEVPSETAPLL